MDVRGIKMMERFAFIAFRSIDLTIILFIFIAHGMGQGTKAPYEWEQIIPLVTKKSEVGRLFGKPFLENGYVSAYTTEKGKLTVWYYGARNLETADCKCSISLDTVSSFSMSLFHRMAVSNLKFDLKRFSKDGYPAGEQRYINEADGISFDVDTAGDGSEWVKSFTYHASKNSTEALCTPNKSSTRPGLR